MTHASLRAIVPTGTVPDPLLTPDEVAARLRHHRNWVYFLVKSGQLTAVKLGRKWVIPQTAVTRYLEQHAQEAIP